MLTNPAINLTKLIDQATGVKGLMEESALSLATVNAALKEEVSKGNAPPQVVQALAINEAAERKVRDASGKLVQMNHALKGELRDRKLLVHQFAAATEQEQAARHAAFHDVLTGLPNRALLDDRLDHGIAHAIRHQWTLAVMFLDLDKFKDINDAYGHDAGDAILKTVACRLLENTRDDDTVSRLGGDEFLFLLVDAGTIANIGAIADKLVKAIQEPIEVRVGNSTDVLSVSASIGISFFPKDGAAAAELVKSADAAMFRAKRDRSGYSFAQ